MKRWIKIVSLTLVFSLMTPSLTYSPSHYNLTVYADELDDKTIYKGLAFTFLLAYFANRFISSDNKSSSGRSSRSGERISYSSYDLNWLAKGVNGESRGEPYEGQVAVAAVIINRVLSDEFPNDIYGVIHQKGQFAAVDDGQINLTPGEEQYKAAKDALYGSDPSRGALFFYNPKTARTLWWLSTRPTTVDIGNHRFAK